MLFTYSDTHTGEFDNYMVRNGETLTVYAYHTNERTPGAYADYEPDASMVYRRTDRTVEGDRAEDPDAWEPNTDVYSPGHDVNPGYTGDELALDGVVYAADFHAPMPPLPHEWQTTRLLVAAPARPGWPVAPVRYRGHTWAHVDTYDQGRMVTLERNENGRTIRTHAPSTVLPN